MPRRSVEGPTEANEVAYDEARKFCEAGGKRAIVVRRRHAMSTRALGLGQRVGRRSIRFAMPPRSANALQAAYLAERFAQMLAAQPLFAQMFGAI